MKTIRINKKVNLKLSKMKQIEEYTKKALIQKNIAFADFF
jgi:hypothetical protein